MTSQLEIVIPVYNEDKSIGATLAQIQSLVKARHTVSIIYDFDEDTTVGAIHSWNANHPDYQINLKKNHYGRGALNAIKTGLLSANADAVLVVMADSSDDLSIVDQMLAKISNGAAVVCGSRYMPGGRQLGGPKFKKFLSQTAGLTLNFLAGLPTKDATNSFKMYRSSFVRSLTIESQGGFEIGLEIVVKAFLAGEKIEEIPTIWRDRSEGASRFRLFAWLPSYLRWYLKAFFRWRGNAKTHLARLKD